MLRVNRQTNYAIRVLLALARRGDDTRASTAEIQKEMLIPRFFAQRIIADLARGSFIKTFPGRDGGVMLSRSARDINLLQLLEYFEDYIFTTGCQKTTGECPLKEDCSICAHMERLKDIIVNELEKISIEDLANNPRHQRYLAIHNLSHNLPAAI